MMLLMPNIQVAGANAMSGAHVIGYPALPAFLGFANTVCRAVRDIVPDKGDCDTPPRFAAKAISPQRLNPKEISLCGR